MTVEQRIKKLSHTLKEQSRVCTDPVKLDELVERRRAVYELGKKITGANINQATAEYEALASALETAAEEIDQKSDEIEDVAKWIERSGQLIGKVCELAEKIA
jgi:phage-related tail protein